MLRRHPVATGALLIHKDGAYNLYSSILDVPLHEPALTLEQLRDVVEKEEGEEGLERLPLRVQRAQLTGSNGTALSTLASVILSNRAGPQRSRLSEEEFIRRYLTLPASQTGIAQA